MKRYEFYMIDQNPYVFEVEHGLIVTALFENGHYHHKFENGKSITVNMAHVISVHEYVLEGESK